MCRFDTLQIDALLRGNTIHVAVPGGEAILFYRKDGHVTARMPDGATRQGTWTLDLAAYTIRWADSGVVGRTLIVREDETLTLLDAESGAGRGTIIRMAPGNAARL